MKNYILLFTLLLFVITNSFAQDSLYLIGTITGESHEKRIVEVKGIGDVNKDGYDDFVIGSVNKEAKLYLGSSDVNLTSYLAFHYPNNGDLVLGFGSPGKIGDVNGDGYDDFSIRGSFDTFGKGKVFLYQGSSSIDTLPFAEFSEPWIQDCFGLRILGINDINKDGYEDFIITSPYNWSNGKGYAYLFWGGDTISWERSITFISPQNMIDDFFGQSVANIGDMNNDGYDDIAISASSFGAFSDTGKVYFYEGGNEIIPIPYCDLRGDEVYSTGDINGDDLTEFIIISFQGTNIYFSFDSVAAFFAGNFCSGNINNDKYGDFIIGNTNYRNNNNIMVGGAFIYFGNETVDTVYKFKLEGENLWGEFSKVMSTADINGDGYDELFILAPSYPDYENEVGKIYIYSYINIVKVEDNIKNRLNSFYLLQNYPNPFNPTTIIKYHLPHTSFVNLKVYDILSRKITTLVNEEQLSGNYEIEFDGSNLSSGVYFYSMQAGEFIDTKKFVLMK